MMTPRLKILNRIDSMGLETPHQCNEKTPLKVPNCAIRSLLTLNIYSF